MKLGIDVFLEKTKDYADKRIGLLTNLTGVNKDLVPTIDLLYNHPDVQLTALFAPEHGIRGDAKEGEAVEAEVDEITQLPVYSLYGKNRKPSKEMLEDIDLIVIDLQDIGSRYYTYIYTMAYVMEACKENNKQVVILDRPNPISGKNKEGNVVEEKFRSFVGLLPIANRHGLTIGELALLFKYEYGYTCDLVVIEMEGWKRDMYFEESNLFWVSPSPNTTNIDMCVLYSGTCLIEGTNLSEGRGTTRPFEVIGAPYISGYEVAKAFNHLNIPGVIARPTSFKPTYQKYNNEQCSGVQLHVTDRDSIKPLETVIKLLEIIARIYPDEFEFISNEKGKYFFDLLAGNGSLKEQIINSETDEYFENAHKELDEFKQISKQYHLYN